MVGEPIRLSYLWRPAVSDPQDDMVLETAVNGRGVRGVSVVTPAEALRRMGDLARRRQLVDGLQLSPDRGSLAGRYSIRVNDQCRITFRFEAGHAWEVRCEDYHS